MIYSDQNILKGYREQKFKLTLYERAFKMLKNNMCITKIGQAVLELLRSEGVPGNPHWIGKILFSYFTNSPSETTESTSIASYLDLLFIRNKSNNITTKLYGKRDAFGFHIVNFSFMSSNIPSAPAYGVYASQLIRCARCCSNYSDFLLRHRALVTRLLSQGYKVNHLSNTFKKFYG